MATEIPGGLNRKNANAEAEASRMQPLEATSAETALAKSDEPARASCSEIDGESHSVEQIYWFLRRLPQSAWPRAMVKLPPEKKQELRKFLLEQRISREQQKKQQLPAGSERRLDDAQSPLDSEDKARVAEGGVDCSRPSLAASEQVQKAEGKHRELAPSPPPRCAAASPEGEGSTCVSGADVKTPSPQSAFSATESGTPPRDSCHPLGLPCTRRSQTEVTPLTFSRRLERATRVRSTAMARLVDVCFAGSASAAAQSARWQLELAQTPAAASG